MRGISQHSLEKQNRMWHIFRQRDSKLYFEEVAHVIVEVWEVQNLQGCLAGWRPRGQLWLSPKTMSPKTMREFLLSQQRLVFVLLRPSNDRMGPTNIMEGNLLLSKPTVLNVNHIRKIHTLSEVFWIMFMQVSEHPIPTRSIAHRLGVIHDEIQSDKEKRFWV